MVVFVCQIENLVIVQLVDHFGFWVANERKKTTFIAFLSVRFLLLLCSNFEFSFFSLHVLGLNAKGGINVLLITNCEGSVFQHSASSRTFYWPEVCPDARSSETALYHTAKLKGSFQNVLSHDLMGVKKKKKNLVNVFVANVIRNIKI